MQTVPKHPHTHNHKLSEQMLIFQLKILYNNNILSYSRQQSHLKPTGIFNHRGLFFIFIKFIYYFLYERTRTKESTIRSK